MPRHGGTGGQPPDPALLIMASLAAGPRHGYAVTRDVVSFAGVRLGSGTVWTGWQPYDAERALVVLAMAPRIAQ